LGPGLVQEKSQKEMNYRRQQDFRSSLDKQREEVENRRVADQLVKQAEAQKLAADAQQYKMEQDRQMREHEKKIVRIKREREEQMADLRRRKEASAAVAKAEQEANMAKLRQAQMVFFICFVVLSCRE